MTFASMMEAASEGRIRGWTGIIVSAEYSSATLWVDITPPEAYGRLSGPSASSGKCSAISSK